MTSLLFDDLCMGRQLSLCNSLRLLVHYSSYIQKIRILVMCEQQLLPTLSKSHVCATTGKRLQQCCRRSSSRSSRRASGATLFPAALQAQVRGVAPGEDRRLSQQLRCCARACMLYASLNRHAFIQCKTQPQHGEGIHLPGRAAEDMDQ